jgi:lysophospholipase L1-like esterase
MKTVLCFAIVALAWAAPAFAQNTTVPLTGPCADVVALQKALDRDEGVLRDWPNLGRYREANLELPPPAPGQPRVVFIGDSITDNWNNPGLGGFFPGKPYINRGISGQTTPQMVLRFRHDVIALKPAAVVILAGTNDIAGNTGPMTLEMIQDNFATMAELATAHGIRFVIASVLPINDVGRAADGSPAIQSKRRPQEKINALNAWLADFARRAGHVYLDYASAVADAQGLLKSDLADDGLHPNLKGYAVMAPLVEKAIQQALQKR